MRVYRYAIGASKGDFKERATVTDGLLILVGTHWEVEADSITLGDPSHDRVCSGRLPSKYLGPQRFRTRLQLLVL